MRWKADGTRFKVPQPPTAAELEAAGLSAEMLPHFFRLIESAEHREPETEGAVSLLQQMQTLGEKEPELSKVREALAIVEVLDDLSFPSFSAFESRHAR